MVGNDLSADHKLLVMITGANRGGKSTFLRAIGPAQLMMQCGMFAPAELSAQSLRCHLHALQAQEDAGMRSGKLDGELRRMSAIIDTDPEQHRSLERVIRRDQRARRLGDRPANRLRFVGEGHQGLLRDPPLRFGARFFPTGDRRRPVPSAERLADGNRNIRLAPGEPLPTSYGEVLYSGKYRAR